MKIFIGWVVLLVIVFYYILLWHRRHLIFYFDDWDGPAENFINLTIAFFIWIVLMGGINLLGVMAGLYLWGMVRPDLHIFPFFSYLAGAVAIIVVILDLASIKYFYYLK